MPRILPPALVLGLILAGCSDPGTAERSGAESDDTSRAAPAPPAPADPASTTATKAEFAGYVAPKPATWTAYPPLNRTRMANWSVPGASGQDQAHVIVETAGGGSRTVIAQWTARFLDADDEPVDAIVEKTMVDGTAITLVELAGRYRKQGAPSFAADHVLLGALWEGPDGPIQVRLVGRTGTVEAARDDFMRLIHGIRPTRANEFPLDWYYADPATRRRYRNTQLLEGYPAPELRLANWIGEPVSLETLVEQDRIVVIDFWATWCNPCMKAIPHNIALTDELGPQGVVVLGIHDARNGSERMPGVAERMKINYPVAVDVDSVSAQAWNVRFWPTYAVVDQDGVVRAAGLKPNRIRDVVEALLRERDAEG